MSDINGNVVGIQGNPVVAETLGASQDGYVLTWDNLDGYIVARPVNTGLHRVYFTGSGTWTCPGGINNVLVIAAAGGGGGSSGGGAGDGGSGGGGSIQVSSCIMVSPNTTYTITIGAGGAGGPSTESGLDGYTTSFGSLFYAFGGGGAPYYVSGTTWSSGVNFSGNTLGSTAPGAAYGGTGGGGITGAPATTAGCSNWTGNGNYVGGNPGARSNGYCGGAGGGAGPQGNGGNGGGANFSGTGGTGNSGGANTGAGGGGGGSGNVGNNGLGGPGGSGYLYIVY